MLLKPDKNNKHMLKEQEYVKQHQLCSMFSEAGVQVFMLNTLLHSETKSEIEETLHSCLKRKKKFCLFIAFIYMFLCFLFSK